MFFCFALLFFSLERTLIEFVISVIDPTHIFAGIIILVLKNDFSATHLLSMSRLGVFYRVPQTFIFYPPKQNKKLHKGWGKLTPVNSQSFFLKNDVLRGSHILHTFWTIKTIENPVQIQLHQCPNRKSAEKRKSEDCQDSKIIM